MAFKDVPTSETEPSAALHVSYSAASSLNKNIINILTTGNIWKKLRNIPAPTEFFRQIEALQQSLKKLIMEQKLEQSINSDYQYVYQS